jgi:acid phosphatase class B
MKKLLTLLFTLGLAFSLGAPVYAAATSPSVLNHTTTNAKKKKKAKKAKKSKKGSSSGMGM